MPDLLQVKFNPEASFLRPNGRGGFTDEGQSRPGNTRIVTGAQLALNWRKGAILPSATNKDLPAVLTLVGRLKNAASPTGGYSVMVDFPGKIRFVAGPSGVEPRFKGDGVLNTGNQRVLTRTISVADLIARSDYLIRISGDGTTIELKNDPGEILIPLPWLFDEKNPMLQLSARLTVDTKSEADEATSAPLDFPMTHALVPDEAVAGDATNHPPLTFFGVRNIATMSLQAGTAKVPFAGKTMNVFIHPTARGFITGSSTATVAAVATALTSILDDAGFGTANVGIDAAADTNSSNRFASRKGHFMSKLIIDKNPTLADTFADTINQNQQSPSIPDDLWQKVPFFDFFIFAENIGSPDPNELAHSELMRRGSGQVTATGDKFLASPIILSTSSGDPLKTLIFATEGSDHANLLATTIAHEIGHTLGLRHAITLNPPANYRMGDPSGRQRHAMAAAGRFPNPDPTKKPLSPLYFFGPVQRAAIRKQFL